MHAEADTGHPSRACPNEFVSDNTTAVVTGLGQKLQQASVKKPVLVAPEGPDGTVDYG